jgi:hypothetical protein
MDNILSYTPNTIIEFEVDTKQMVAIQSVNNLAPVINLKFPVCDAQACLVGRWIIECKKQTIYLRENDSEETDDCIVVSFQEGIVKIKAVYFSESQPIVQTFDKTSRIDVYPREVGKLKIQTAQAQQIPTEDVSSSVERVPEGHNSNNAGEETQRLKEKLEREEDIVKHLREIVDAKIDEAISAASQNMEYLSSDIQEKLKIHNSLLNEQTRLEVEEKNVLDMIDTANLNINDTRNIVDRKKIELVELQHQLKTLEEQKELIDLDCDASQKQVDEIKAQVNLDAETAELLESEGRLKHGSISKTLQEMDKEIEKVEKKIAFIIKYRTKFNQVVEDAIFNGDGTILTSDEAGGNANGNRSSAPEENQ